MADSIRLTDVTVTFSKPQRVSQTLDVQLDGIPRIPTQRDATDLRGIWDWHGGMEISSESKLEIKIPVDRRVSILGTKTTSVLVPVGEILSSCSEGPVHGKWQKSYPKYDLSFGYTKPGMEPISIVPSSSGSTSTSPANSDTDLPSTTDDITSICPRFRVLVIGKTGVGKSSLINHAFGVTDASVSKGKPGVHDINFEIQSKENERFVVHDSQGFEPGEEDNFNIVTKFIDERRRKTDLKDKLHAIWLCIEIPCSGGRVFETGDENFIKLHLGHVPVVIVFTKFDQLVTLKQMHLPASRIKGLSKTEMTELARTDAEKAFEQICLEPLRKVVQKNVPPFIKVSTALGYTQTLSELVDLTYKNVQKYVAEEASLVGAIAQRTSSDTKIYASIAVGKRRYWDGLGRSVNFPGRSLKSCLNVIHKDIVTVWNFQDPKRHLESNQFKALMTNIVDDLVEKDVLDPNKTFIGGLSLIGTVAGIVGGLSGPAAPIVIPIVASFVFAKWVYDVYQQSGPVLRCLMGYIVDLTITMQILFILTRGDPRPISRRVIKVAIKAYRESPAKSQIHAQIQEYVGQNDVFKRMGRDGVLAKIVQLIEQWKIEEAEGVKLQSCLGNDVLESLRRAEDEPWDAVEGSRGRE